MLGRPASWAPVMKNVTAGSWLIASVCIDLMKHSSSATRAVCGNSSLSQAPRLAVLREPEPRRRDGETRLPRGHAGEPLPHPNGVGQLGRPQIGQSRLIVEQVHLRRPARLEEIDDPLGPRPEVRKARQSAQSRCWA